MPSLQRIEISGFRSIRNAAMDFRPMNVLVGANGAGKSNLVAFFKLLNEMTEGRLQQFLGSTGRAQANLYFGPKVTPQLAATLEFETDSGTATYRMRLVHAAGDSLVFANEDVSFLQRDGNGKPKQLSLGAGHQETRMSDESRTDEPTAILRFLLRNCRVFHFHDTSSSAGVRQFCYTGDHHWLMPDAANLAAILFRWKQSQERTYRRVVATIRQIAPFFDDFVLVPEGRDIILNWRHRKSDHVFGPHQFSDGTLRAICLVALLLQPVAELPSLIVVDEPELGLHPFALNLVAGLFRAAANHTQVLISTQSSAFLDNFESDDIVVAEREGEETRFSRPGEEKLAAWLEDYSLGEVWEKNVIGGGPH